MHPMAGGSVILGLEQQTFHEKRDNSRKHASIADERDDMDFECPLPSITRRKAKTAMRTTDCGRHEGRMGQATPCLSLQGANTA